MTQPSPDSEALDDVAVVGLGVMGANLARNFARRGLRVGGFDLDPGAGARLAASEPDGQFCISASLAEMVARLERPRRIILLVNAGPAVDAVLDGLAPHLEADDIVVDGGNSLYTDTDRRNARAASEVWRFVGMGISGGSEGALLGPSLMPGGDVEAWRRLSPVLTAISAKSASGPCVTYCGRGSAGHFVKMTHNGIEYGDMQLIAEAATLLRRGLGQSAAQVSATFAAWNEQELDSYLIDITADIFLADDPQQPGAPLVDAIVDQAGQKGTGRWTVMAAIELGVPIPTIAAALDARALSSGRGLRLEAEGALRPRDAEPFAGVDVDTLRRALFASKMASYTQGFAMLRAASAERDYGIDLAEVARIWTAGCIIRAGFLGVISETYRADPELPLLALAPALAPQLREATPALRRTVSAAALAGIPVPALSASLGWLETLATARGSANIIQAQRDYFGSHTYRRIDAPDVPVHTDWPRRGR
ncbi:MAG: NADP-dependent phosphogluconate dehydrogenase [Sandaracinaceae bacterium]|nr:NADP-dependent phosphogluconate dehydrogenase [Myxococcales bacterium]MCB9656446.1 NADP-dependent phosphogluconate dehydrogenase [Sandaracinaceae bacterium]